MSAALPVHGAMRSSSAIFSRAISCERSATLPQSFFGSTFAGVFRFSPRSSSADVFAARLGFLECVVGRRLAVVAGLGEHIARRRRLAFPFHLAVVIIDDGKHRGQLAQHLPRLSLTAAQKSLPRFHIRRPTACPSDLISSCSVSAEISFDQAYVPPVERSLRSHRLLIPLPVGARRLSRCASRRIVRPRSHQRLPSVRKEHVQHSIVPLRRRRSHFGIRLRNYRRNSDQTPPPRQPRKWLLSTLPRRGRMDVAP